MQNSCAKDGGSKPMVFDMIASFLKTAGFAALNANLSTYILNSF